MRAGLGLMLIHGLVACVQLACVAVGGVWASSVVCVLSGLSSWVVYLWLHRSDRANRRGVGFSLGIWVLVLLGSLTLPPLALIASGRTAYDVGMTGYFAISESPWLGLAPLVVLLSHLLLGRMVRQ